MTILLIVFYVAIVLLISGVMFFIVRLVRNPERQINKRVEEFSEVYNKQEEDDTPRILQNQDFGHLTALNTLLDKLSVLKKINRLIKQADSKLTAAKLIVFIVFMSFLGFLIGMKINVFFMIVFMAGFGSIPVVHLYIQRAKRLKAFIRAFPDSIDMMASAIRAGHAFNQAMQLVGNEAPDPVGIEFKRTYEQYNLGLNLKDVLLEMTDRVNSLDLKLFVTAILLQKETGGNLTEILDKISYTIRERFKLIGQIKTFTAQGRMSAIILGALPLVFVLFISGLNPDYLTPLFHDKLGHYFILIAVFLQIFGFIVIQKIVKIKYQ
ncbi:type II secretion system F family protein [bacterium]|nr:type II secretion system F family protein [bacterium]